MAESAITREVRVPGAHNIRGAPQLGDNIELENVNQHRSSRDAIATQECQNLLPDPEQQEEMVELESHYTENKKSGNIIKGGCCLDDMKKTETFTNRGICICIRVLPWLLCAGFAGFLIGYFAASKYPKPTVFQPSAQQNPLDRGVLEHQEGISPEIGFLEHLGRKKMQLNLGIRNDFLLQDCTDRGLKKSFPDLDYALLGYHILKGYPMAIGHDPGFTNPIFEADYSSNRQTGDCKFSIPTGYTVIPDVSCQTSMSSKVVKNSQELKESMGASAKVSGGGWGASFGASTDYKKTSQTVESGHKVMVISTATCQYYYAKIDEMDPPPFTDSFLKALIKLNNSDTENYVDVYLDFINYYGTHFMKMVTFGARYMKEHSMSSSSYSELKTESLSVEAMASFSSSGGVNAEASFGMSSGQSNAVSKFKQKVETKTITVGSPPPSNGDAMTWASTVKETPVPFSYEMESIEELFTPTFMTRYPDIDYNKLKQTIDYIKTRYSRLVYRSALEGESKCRVYDAPFEIQDFHMPEIDLQTGVQGQQRCNQMCFEESNCMAVFTYQERCYSTKQTDLTAAYQKGLGIWMTVFPYKLNVESQSNYKATKVAAKFYLRKVKVKVNEKDDAFKLTTTTTTIATTTTKDKSKRAKSKSTLKCYSSNGSGDKCVSLCIEDSNCVMAYQIKHPQRADKYCCGVVDEFDVQNLEFEGSSDRNEYIVFIKTKC